MNTVPLVSLNQFGLIVLGVTIAIVVLILMVYLINELRIVRRNQRKLLEALGLDEDTDSEQVKEVVYRAAKY